MPDQDQFISAPVPEHTAEESGAQLVVECCRVFLRTVMLSLQSLEEDLSYPENSEAMGEWRDPQSVGFALRGILECVRVDDLEPALKSLEEAVNLTPEALYQEWQRRQAEREKGAGPG